MKRGPFSFLLIVVFLAILLSLPLTVSQNIKIKVVDFFSPLISWTQRLFSIGDLFSAISENKALKKRLEELSMQLNNLKEAEKEAERLRGLLDFKKNLSYKTIACRVIARDASAWYKTLIIDKGKSSGARIDMPVIGGGGVIGRVIESSEGVSRVLLITDVNSSIGAITQDTRTVGLVEGDGRGGCILNLIPVDIDVHPGSVVVTSGLGEIFPSGLLIGTVISVSGGGQGLYKVAQVKLASDIDRVEEVIVILCD